MLLPPLLAGGAVLCLLLAVAMSFSQRTKADNPLAAGDTPDQLARQLTVDLEGTPTPADIRRAQKPLSERRRILHGHPYFSLYKIAKRRFGVSWYLVAAVHYQETGFGEAPQTLAETIHWKRHRQAATSGILRPSTYPNRSRRHPSVKDDFDVVMAIAADLRAGGAQNLGRDARRAVGARYGPGPRGRLATAMVLERARAWRLLGTLPLPGSGELATPVKGVIGGCGYFGCPRPGHLHNGVDFLAPTGTPIHAAEAGQVASVESPGGSGGYGNFVCIQHRPHLATCYAHMSAFAAAMRPGARVKRGQVIGLVGSTGSSSAPHLHLEVRRGPAACSACAVDPLPLLSGDVPDAALPQLVDSITRASSGPTNAVAPAPVTPVAPAAPVTVEDSAGAAPREHSGSTRGRNHDDAAATGGAVPGTTARPPAKPTPAAAATAPAPAPAAAPQPAPPSPTADPGTGGAAPTIGPSAPAPAAEAPAPATPG